MPRSGCRSYFMLSSVPDTPPSAPNSQTPQARATCLLLSLALAAPACGSDTSSGSLSVLLESEDTIVNGLEPGTGAEDIRDGFTVTFDRYIAVLGDIRLHPSTDPEVTRRDAATFAVDLSHISAQGEELWQFDDLDAGRWEFHYALGTGSSKTQRHESVKKSDFERIVSERLTYLISGTLEKPDGVSCPPPEAALVDTDTATSENSAGIACYPNPKIHFELGLAAATRFGPCEVDGIPGVSVPSGGMATVAATLHGDHLFFNGFPEGAEGGIHRLAQLWADADLNVDGELTLEELEQLAPAQMSELDERYQLGGALIPLETLADYARAQLMTQGHMDGEGECPPS